MKFDYNNFCRKLKELRKIRGLNKFQMSIQSNIHYGYYCNIENGKSIPNFKALVSIANALKVDLSTLLDCKESIEDTSLKINILSNLKSMNNEYLLHKSLKVLYMLKEQDI